MPDILNFYRVASKNTYCRNITRSATQTYQSLTVSFGFIEFLSGSVGFLSETSIFYRRFNFYRVASKNTHCRNINRPATQTYQSLTTSFGFVDFLSGSVAFLSERPIFYREILFISGGIEKCILSEYSSISNTNVPVVDSIIRFCRISIGNC